MKRQNHFPSCCASSLAETPSWQHRGFTMVELALVLVIVVVVAALAIPAVQNTVSAQTIKKSGDRVRVAMGQARVRAIRSGEVYALYYEQGGQWFEVAPLENYSEYSNRPRNPDQITPISQEFSDNLLPRDVRFVGAESRVDNRSASAMENADGASGMDAILFYPDGTSQDAKLYLQNQKGALISVELRGLTGIAKTLRVTSNDGVAR